MRRPTNVKQLAYKTYWMTCRKMTVKAVVDKNRIILSSSPIVKKFVGQPLDNLKSWLIKFGGFEIVEINKGDGSAPRGLIRTRSVFDA